jgi:hypothetical protein
MTEIVEYSAKHRVQASFEYFQESLSISSMLFYIVITEKNYFNWKRGCHWSENRFIDPATTTPRINWSNNAFHLTGSKKTEDSPNTIRQIWDVISNDILSNGWWILVYWLIWYWYSIRMTWSSSYIKWHSS